MNILIVTLSHIYLNNDLHSINPDALRRINVYKHSTFLFLSNVCIKFDNLLKKKKNVTKSLLKINF